MGMKLSKELEQRILSAPGVIVRQAGMIEQPAEDWSEPKELKLVEPSVVVIGGIFVAFIPAVTRTEANEPRWTKKMRRKLSAKEAVRRTLGPHLQMLVPLAEAYHAGKMLKATFTRMGGRQLDPCNLPTSMKSIEDTVAGALLANDGDPRWSPRWQQEPGGLVGVRIEIEAMSD